VARVRSSRLVALGVALPTLLAFACVVRAGPVEDARALVREDRPRDAEALLERRVRAAPDDVAAWAAYGEVLRVRCRLDAAEAAYRRALDHDLLDPRARAGLAEVLLLGGRAAEALREAELAIAGQAGRAELSGRPWRARALALVELRRYDLAVRAARRAVAISPDDPRCLEALASAEFRSGSMEAARAAYEQAVGLDPRTEEANLRLGNGFACEACERPWREDCAEGNAFRAAVRAWEDGRLAEAEDRFLALAHQRPEAYKYRLGVGLLRVAIRRRNEHRLGGDPTPLYRRLPGPAFEGIERVVLGYASLGPLESHVVRVAVAPARSLWPALVTSGATHEVISLEADLTDAEERRSLSGQRTFDGRLYGHLRGVGGPQGATGAEKLREAAELGFNTFAHEFGHQVHRKGLDADQQREVDGLYAAAIAEGRTLDYYAASNVDEYFAQGYEAFVSPVKRGCLAETARHTRDELATKDPALMGFLLRVLDTSHESAEAVEALRAQAEAPPGDAPRPEPAPR
jgi:Flp pilus assembly protein TadD